MISKNEFGNIYEEYFDKLYSYIFFRINNELVAEDLVSQVFFKALRNQSSYDSSKWKISTWLFTIASNLLIDYYRKDEQFENIEDYENSLFEKEEFGENIDFEINLEKVNNSIKKLPTKTQEIIMLRIYQELSYWEIAKIIWISESGVKMSFIRWIEAVKNSINLLIMLIYLIIN